MLSSWSDLVDASESSLNWRFVALFRAAVDDGFPPLEVTAPCPVVDKLPSASSVASRLLKAISTQQETHTQWYIVLARNVVVKQFQNGLGPIKLITILIEHRLVFAALTLTWYHLDAMDRYWMFN